MASSLSPSSSGRVPAHARSLRHMLHTRFTDLVGCDVPVQLAPMGAISSSDLLRAVVDAGGMGMCSLPMAPADAVVQMLDALREVTPIGFNVLVPFLDLDVIDAAASRLPARRLLPRAG